MSQGFANRLSPTSLGKPGRVWSVAPFLALLAVLFNIFGWTLLGHNEASAATPQIALGQSLMAQADICHSNAQPGTPIGAPHGKPVCVQCFPLASSCSGALLPETVALAQPSLRQTTPQSSDGHDLARQAPSLAYPARAPPRQF